MKSKRLRFLIVPACTDLNRGDQALVWESARLLFDAYGIETDVNIVDYGSTYEERKRQSDQTRAAGYKVIRNLVDNPKRSISNLHYRLGLTSYFKVALTALFDFAGQLLLFLFPYKFISKLVFCESQKVASFELLKASDGVVVKGGGFVHTYGHLQDPYYLWFNLYYAILALRLRKKVIIFPNSFGPVEGRINRIILRMIVNRCSLVYAREKKSFDCLTRVGCKNIKMHNDLAYYATIENTRSIVTDIPNTGKPKIGITVRPYRFPESDDPDQAYKHYVTAIANFCDFASDYEIYFVVQVQGPSAHENDRIAISDVMKECQRNDIEVIDGAYDYKDLLLIYSKMDYLIGTRFHSVVFSQLSGIPSLAIAYGGNKSEGIMSQIGLGDFVIDINNISENEIKEKFKKLVYDAENYAAKLSAFRAQLSGSRRDIIEDLKRVFI